MRIRHSRLTRDFLQVPNATVRDDRLSHMARGILVELLSRPDGWKATADDMWRASVAKHGKASPGRRAFRAAFAELKEGGYLSADLESLEKGQIATTLILTDVPHGGTSARPGTSGKTPAQTDVPHGGTSVGSTDVPDGGTSARPAETSKIAGRTEVPPSGTSARPAQTGLSAARTDVPHGGTSNTEYGKTNTEKKTTTSVAAARDLTAEEKQEYGNFWLLHPKSKNPDVTHELWTAAVLGGVDPQKITAAAVAYAREKAGEPFRFIKQSDNWLRERRYEDKYAPELSGKPQLRAVGGKHQPFQPPTDHSVYENGFPNARAQAPGR